MEAPNIEQAYNIRSDERYSIDDLPIHDDKNKVIATVSVTRLYGGQMTRGHVHPDTGEFYFFVSGSGMIQIGTTEQRLVRENSVVYIPRNTFHRVTNRSDYTDLLFYTFYPGESARPGF